MLERHSGLIAFLGDHGSLHWSQGLEEVWKVHCPHQIDGRSRIATHFKADLFRLDFTNTSSHELQTQTHRRTCIGRSSNKAGSQCRRFHLTALITIQQERFQVRVVYVSACALRLASSALHNSICRHFAAFVVIKDFVETQPPPHTCALEAHACFQFALGIAKLFTLLETSLTPKPLNP